MIVTGSWAPTFKEKANFDWDIAVEPGNKKRQRTSSQMD